MRYQYIDHTSDLGMEIFGKDLPELFANASYAMFDNIVDLASIEERETRTISLKNQNLQDLFIDWLRELLFIFATEYFVVKNVKKIKVIDNVLNAELCGEKFDKSRHQIKIEIKTPTYHMYKIEKKEKGYQATIIFDV